MWLMSSFCMSCLMIKLEYFENHQEVVHLLISKKEIVSHFILREILG